MKIPIHKHTPVRYKMSYWVTRVEVMVAVRNTSKGMFDPLSPLVTDISRVARSVKQKRFELDRAMQDHLDKLSIPMPYQQFQPIKKLGWFENIKYHIIWWKK